MVFLKAPRPGFVKTRLGRQIGIDGATRLYRALAERQLRSVPAGFAVEIHYAPQDAAAEMRAWLGAGRQYRAQKGGDLGQRLTHAFAGGFGRGATPIIAIGADCPSLDGDCLVGAREKLRQSDVVLGPATDGGYYLVGLRRPAPQLFTDIPWSSSAVLKTTLARIAELGLSCQLLPTMEDIDDMAALRRHLERDASTVFDHPRPDLMRAV